MELLLWIGGIVFWAYLLSWICVTLNNRLVRTAYDWSKYKGEWAVITGSSYGTGKSFAMSLAKRGLNVVIIARSQNSLESVAKEIKDKYPDVEVKGIPADLTENAEQAYKAIADGIKSLTVSVLINNVGGTGDRKLESPMDYMHNIPADYDAYIQKLNCIPTFRLSKMVLPGMVNRKKGAILNVSSLSSVYGMPFLSSYACAKASINMFTNIMAMEYYRQGIDVGLAYGGAISTPSLMEGSMKLLAEYGACTPERFAEDALKLFGTSITVTPYWIHALQNLGLSVLPAWARFYVITSTGYKMKQDIEQAIQQDAQKKNS